MPAESGKKEYPVKKEGTNILKEINTVKGTRIPVADLQNRRCVSVHQYFSHNLGYKILWEKPKY